MAVPDIPGENSEHSQNRAAKRDDVLNRRGSVTLNLSEVDAQTLRDFEVSVFNRILLSAQSCMTQDSYQLHELKLAALHSHSILLLLKLVVGFFAEASTCQMSLC